MNRRKTGFSYSKLDHIERNISLISELYIFDHAKIRQFYYYNLDSVTTIKYLKEIARVAYQLFGQKTVLKIEPSKLSIFVLTIIIEVDENNYSAKFERMFRKYVFSLNKHLKSFYFFVIERRKT